MEPATPDYSILLGVLQTRMPFGKYKGTIIADLPVSYLEWMYRNGMPPGKLGMMLSTIHEIKINGMMSILYELKKRLPPQPR
ncbi:DUF3820 family protein [Mucilaginibacter agri]|nr:DUF3820 family protein [Mucilaginibacter agri]